jgi:hypothetical protein
MAQRREWREGEDVVKEDIIKDRILGKSKYHEGHVKV